MTCNEFRACNKDGVDGILALTRAERSAAGQHWAECFECREWSMGVVFKMTPRQELAVESTKCADRQDPETFHLALEEAEKFDMDTESTSKETKRASSI